MSKLPASEEAEVACKKCCHFIEALVQMCPEGGLCEDASRLPALSEDGTGSEDKFQCSFTASGEHVPSSTGDCIYCASRGREHAMRPVLNDGPAPEEDMQRIEFDDEDEELLADANKLQHPDDIEDGPAEGIATERERCEGCMWFLPNHHPTCFRKSDPVEPAAPVVQFEIIDGQNDDLRFTTSQPTPVVVPEIAICPKCNRPHYNMEDSEFCRSMSEPAYPRWECFHCGFKTSEHNQAAAHFGDRDDAEEFKPLCKWWQRMDDGERAEALQDTIQQLNDALSAQSAPLPSDEILKSRDKQSFDAGFSAGTDYIQLGKEYAHQLVSQAVADRIDDTWLVRARDYLDKTTAALPVGQKETK